MAGFERSALSHGQCSFGDVDVEVTPRLVRAALTKARRSGIYWRLEPAERALLVLASRLRRIRSPLLREALLAVLQRVWPQKALVIRAYELGLKLISRKAQLALRLGMRSAAEGLLSLARDARLVILAGLSYLNTPPFYRPPLP